jgi:hypothetical protein
MEKRGNNHKTGRLAGNLQYGKQETYQAVDATQRRSNVNTQTQIHPILEVKQTATYFTLYMAGRENEDPCY